MDFNFVDADTPSKKLDLVDFYFKSIISLLMKIYTADIIKNEDLQEEQDFLESLRSFSKYFYHVYFLLKTYVLYKKKSIKTSEIAFNNIKEYSQEFSLFRNDIFLLSLNFFATRNEANLVKKEAFAELDLFRKELHTINPFLSKF